jgi:isoleucyl-tRNA synthetase
VRRSRRRFWRARLSFSDDGKSEDDTDKQMAYKTLHYILVRLAYVLAPFTPFLAEELYSKLTGDRESIHLKDWLPAGPVNELAINEMSNVRLVINEILSLRAGAGIKIRQPLSYAKVETATTISEELQQVVLEEVNIKKIDFVTDPKLANQKENVKIGVELNITPQLRREGMMREVVRIVQAARKEAGLNVDDRIHLGLSTDDKQLQKAITEHAGTIQAETLAKTVAGSLNSPLYRTTKTVDGTELQVSLQKA